MFFENILKTSGISMETLAQLCNVSVRTIRDWKREKYRAEYDAVIFLSKKFHTKTGTIKKVDIREHLLSVASSGGMARYERYGPVSSQEDRKRGGRISQSLRRSSPQKYRLLGCNVRKDFKNPKYSEKFAEVIGILLGDGALNDYQVRVTLSKTVDREYAHFVRVLMRDVFGENPSWRERHNVIEITLSGAALVEVLENRGLRRGNKVRHQVDIPKWIFTNKKYQRACLRGLFDTDGGIYRHKKEKRTYVGWSFSNHSRPIIKGVMDILYAHGIANSLQNETKVYIYSFADIMRYMEVVGSHNPKNMQRIVGARSKF